MLARLIRRRSLATVAVVLALVLPGVPFARAASVTCSVCPPDCPMHGKAKKRLGCHRAAGSADAKRHDGCARTPGVSLPGCGYHGDALVVALAPAIPPASLISWAMAAEAAPPPSLAAPHTRGAEPPDTPPPIASL